MRIQGHRIVIGASVGIALSPDHGTGASALFGHADLALYASKDAGRGTASPVRSENERSGAGRAHA